eukprot:5109633-Amphidinium_carterae.2
MHLQEWYDDDNGDYDANELQTAIKEEHDSLQKTNVFTRVQTTNYNQQHLKEDEENKKTCLQKLLSISWHYAPTFFENLKKQDFNRLREEGWEEAQVLQHEQVLRDTKILALRSITSTCYGHVDKTWTSTTELATWRSEPYRLTTWLLQLPHGSTIRHL